VNINEILYRRTDLSTFIVHLTRDLQSKTAKENLVSIIKDDKIKAMNPFGHNCDRFNQERAVLELHKCVCFTEATLENLYLFFQDIDGRKCNFKPYGIAITKKIARDMGVNPVWYLDITPGGGREWLTKSVDQLVQAALKVEEPALEPIFKLTPFIEQMGNGNGGRRKYRKEFWWEREWRHVGDFILPDYIVLCPESEISEFESLRVSQNHAIRACIDPCWGLEMIISKLAGFKNRQIKVISS
jgi:hypothetical protein